MPAQIHETRHLPTRPGERLEVAFTFPTEARPGGAIVCSPQPFLGGDMDNNVVREMSTSLAGAGLPVMRFNYRSVGKSHAVLPGLARYEYWKEVEETGRHDGVLQDADEAFDRATRLFDPSVVCGYSFGAFVAMHLAGKRAPELPVVLVAPPIGRLDFRPLTERTGPVLLVLAGRDELDPAPSRDDLTRCYPGARIAVIEDANHFFIGREESLREPLLDFLAAGDESERDQ